MSSEAHAVEANAVNDRSNSPRRSQRSRSITLVDASLGNQSKGTHVKLPHTIAIAYQRAESVNAATMPTAPSRSNASLASTPATTPHRPCAERTPSAVMNSARLIAPHVIGSRMSQVAPTTGPHRG